MGIKEKTCGIITTNEEYYLGLFCGNRGVLKLDGRRVGAKNLEECINKYIDKIPSPKKITENHLYFLVMAGGMDALKKYGEKGIFKINPKNIKSYVENEKLVKCFKIFLKNGKEKDFKKFFEDNQKRL